MSWGSADAVIVGGGVIGCSIAYHLAGRGAKVVLVERDALGSQSTGKCAGGVRRQFSSEPNVVMPQLSIRLLAGLDVLNVFQVTGLDPVHEIYFMEPSPAKKGDFFEFFAEIDLLCAISTCPSGDLSEWGWGPDQSDPVATCRPLGVEVYDLDEGLRKDGPRHSPCESSPSTGPSREHNARPESEAVSLRSISSSVF